MHLIRRNGAFLCGIYLQTHSGNWDYEIIFHIYNLMVDFPVISLSSDTFLLNHKGARDGVTLFQHKEGFSNYAERLKQQIPLLQKDIISCNELVTYITLSAILPNRCETLYLLYSSVERSQKRNRKLQMQKESYLNGMMMQHNVLVV